MPGSAPDFKTEIKTYILSNFPDPDTTILDIGAGSGVYADLLNPPYRRIDALEVHLPYIEQFDLLKKYRRVIHDDMRTYSFKQPYDIFILGDCLEHLTTHEATELLQKLHNRCHELIISVPFLTKQGAVAGVEWEVHKQDDLTLDVMQERYQEWLKPLFWGKRIGIYIKRLK